jgi:hypothetical protein
MSISGVPVPDIKWASMAPEGDLGVDQAVIYMFTFATPGKAMGSLYNVTNHLDPNFSIVGRSAQRPRADVGGYATGVPYLSDRPTDGRNRKAEYLQGTNGQVKITVSTRSTDQKTINSAQLAFIDNKEFDRPRLLSIQTVNSLIVQGATRRFDQTKNKFVGPRGELDHKKAILDRFKLLGVVSNNDVDTGAIHYVRPPRTFTLVTWGDCHVLDYWSNRKNILRRYDECYLVLRRVKITSSYTFQDDLTVGRLDIPKEMHVPVEKDTYYWQWVPVSCRRGSLPADLLKNEWEDKNGTVRHEIGSYLRVGHVHEYADIAPHKEYRIRDETSVARDVAYLHRNGRVRPFQFYLHLNDDTNLV